MSVELIAEIARLKDANELLIANQVHIKDKRDSVKHKVANIIEEQILYDLRLVVHALSRTKPKLDIALHKLDLMEEQAEKALRLSGRLK